MRWMSAQLLSDSLPIRFVFITGHSAALTAVAEFEHDLLSERMPAGIARACAESKVMGRSTVLAKVQQAVAIRRHADGVSVSPLVRGTTTRLASPLCEFEMKVRKIKNYEGACRNALFFR